MNGLFSRNVAALSPSATLAVSKEAARLRREGVNVVDLGAGEPDFPTPKLAAGGPSPVHKIVVKVAVDPAGV